MAGWTPLGCATGVVGSKIETKTEFFVLETKTMVSRTHGPELETMISSCPTFLSIVSLPLPIVRLPLPFTFSVLFSEAQVHKCLPLEQFSYSPIQRTPSHVSRHRR